MPVISSIQPSRAAVLLCVVASIFFFSGCNKKSETESPASPTRSVLTGACGARSANRACAFLLGGE
jgi:hypothetical protein